MCPVGSELSYADRQTGKSKLVVAFRNFAKALKKYNFFYCFVRTWIFLLC